jgi:hypothetical protein
MSKKKRKKPRARLTKYLVDYTKNGLLFASDIFAKTDIDAIFLCNYMNIFDEKMNMHILGKRSDCVDFRNTKLQ